MFDKFDFTGAGDIYNPCEYDPALSFEELEFILTEDMFQATYMIDGDSYTIDVGWYPDGGEDGAYHIVLIKNCDWQEPLQSRWTRCYPLLEEYMSDFLDYLFGRSETVRQLSVFMVKHERVFAEDNKESRTIGIYTTKVKAYHAVERAKELPAFREQPDNFTIEEYELDYEEFS